MTRYLSLLNFTDQGVRDAKNSPMRAADFRAAVAKAGGKVLAQYWLVGEADACVIFEAPDEEAAAGLLLSLAKLGNVRSRSLRAFDDAEFGRIAAKT